MPLRAASGPALTLSEAARVPLRGGAQWASVWVGRGAGELKGDLSPIVSVVSARMNVTVAV